MDCSPPGSLVHGILQARILEWLPFPSPGSSQAREQTSVSGIAGRFFITWVTGEAQVYRYAIPTMFWKDYEYLWAYFSEHHITAKISLCRFVLHTLTYYSTILCSISFLQKCLSLSKMLSVFSKYQSCSQLSKSIFLWIRFSMKEELRLERGTKSWVFVEALTWGRSYPPNAEHHF